MCSLTKDNQPKSNCKVSTTLASGVAPRFPHAHHATKQGADMNSATSTSFRKASLASGLTRSQERRDAQPPLPQATRKDKQKQSKTNASNRFLTTFASPRLLLAVVFSCENQASENEHPGNLSSPPFFGTRRGAKFWHQKTHHKQAFEETQILIGKSV